MYQTVRTCRGPVGGRTGWPFLKRGCALPSRVFRSMPSRSGGLEPRCVAPVGLDATRVGPMTIARRAGSAGPFDVRWRRVPFASPVSPNPWPRRPCSRAAAHQARCIWGFARPSRENWRRMPGCGLAERSSPVAWATSSSPSWPGSTEPRKAEFTSADGLRPCQRLLAHAAAVPCSQGRAAPGAVGEAGDRGMGRTLRSGASRSGHPASASPCSRKRARTRSSHPLG